MKRISEIKKQINKSKDGKTVFANFGYLSLLQVAGYVFPLISMPYLARVIGADGFGKIAFASAIVVWIQTISDWGFNLTATRDVAQNRDNKELVSRIFSNVLWARSVLTLLSGMKMPSYNYIKSIYLSLLPIYPFYYYTKKGYLTAERLRIWGLIFLASVTMSYFRMQREALAQLVEEGSSVEEVTNNTGYLFLSILPMLVIYRKKPLLQFASFAFVMAFLIIGMKRGAIIIGAISAIYFMWRVIKSSRGNTRFLFIFLSVAICGGVVYFFIHEMATSDYMQQRLESTMEGNSSGRDNLYSFFWHYFTDEADVLHYLIGRGANGTLEIYYNYAHNDWLEIAVNQGVLGLVVYAFYFLEFYKTWKCATNTDAKTILALMLFIFFAMTLFSMSYADMTYVATAPFGYALATINKPN